MRQQCERQAFVSAPFEWSRHALSEGLITWTLTHFYLCIIIDICKIMSNEKTITRLITDMKRRKKVQIEFQETPLSLHTNVHFHKDFMVAFLWHVVAL